MPAAESIWTIGHSTRTLEELIAALLAHGIKTLADVRSFPTSARHPQVNRSHLATALPRAGRRAGWSTTWAYPGNFCAPPAPPGPGRRSLSPAVSPAAIEWRG